MAAGLAKSIITGLGPLSQPLGTPVSTKPALGSGVFNNTVGAAAEKVLAGGGSTKVRRVKLCCPLAGRNLGYTTVTQGAAAPTVTAVGDGTVTDGSLVVGGNGATDAFELADYLDLYLAASAAATPYNLTVVED